MTQVKDITQRVKEHLEALREFTATPGEGVTRLPFTNEARQAIDYLRNAMEEAGLSVRLDATGALIGRLEGTDPDAPAIMIGSHYDTVRSGGAYDGIAGVVAAIETVRVIRESGAKLRHPIDVCAFNDEEGIMYGIGFLSSKAMIGARTVRELKEYKDPSGESLYDAMKRFGLEPEDISSCALDPEKVRCFLEVHIEQGPVLHAKGIELGLVDVIAGLRRYRITMRGEANHAGSTPMDMRHDAVEAAAKVISLIPGWAREVGEGTVATVGYMRVSPNALNTVAGEVEWTIDCRSSRMENVNAVLIKMMQKLEEVKEETGVEYVFEPLVSIEPGVMEPHLVDLLEEACKEKDYSCRRMLSGASHDAHILCEKVPCAMIFIPSKDGVSHSPLEHSEYFDLAHAIDVSAAMVMKLDRE
ncbi:MAG: Zn-dependent hydrolase [Clostridia bacterium]|nr:Zn-dependent hydrolase [Clostridia bacterium]